jgi:hypothetical protein
VTSGYRHFKCHAEVLQSLGLTLLMALFASSELPGATCESRQAMKSYSRLLRRISAYQIDTPH